MTWHIISPHHFFLVAYDHSLTTCCRFLRILTGQVPTNWHWNLRTPTLFVRYPQFVWYQRKELSTSIRVYLVHIGPLEFQQGLTMPGVTKVWWLRARDAPRRFSAYLVLTILQNPTRPKGPFPTAWKSAILTASQGIHPPFFSLLCFASPSLTPSSSSTYPWSFSSSSSPFPVAIAIKVFWARHRVSREYQDQEGFGRRTREPRGKPKFHQCRVIPSHPTIHPLRTPPICDFCTWSHDARKSATYVG